MIASVTTLDVGMAVTILVGVLIIILAVVWSVNWAVLRQADKIGPLAKAEQDHRIETHRVESILKAKRCEAEIALADAKIIEAKAKVVEAQSRANELDMERLDRQLTRGRPE